MKEKKERERKKERKRERKGKKRKKHCHYNATPSKSCVSLNEFPGLRQARECKANPP